MSSTVQIEITTKKVLVITLAIQLALLGSVALDKMNLNIPLLRQLVGFVYLAFIPGYLILKILRVQTDALETILFSVGLSISFVMFIGFVVNALCLLIGLEKPISEVPLLVAFTLSVLFLCIIAYLYNRNYNMYFKIDLSKVLSPWTLLFVSLPFMAIFGTYLVYYHNNNIMLLIILTVISIAPILIVFSKIPESIYPLFVWTLSISILLHNSLYSNYLIDFDSYIEYYISNLVRVNGFWNIGFPSKINSLLAITIIPSVFSFICELSLTLVFKIIFPLFYSIVPVILFRTFKFLFDSEIAFLSSYFFIIIREFYTEMLGICRQQMAEIYLALILLLILTSRSSLNSSWKILMIAFLWSIVVSHYGTTYIFMFMLIAFKFIHDVFTKFKFSFKFLQKPIDTYTILIYISLILVWYTLTSSSSSFKVIINLANSAITSLNEMFSPSVSDTIYYLTRKEPALSLLINKAIYITINVLISISVLSALLRLVKLNRDNVEKISKHMMYFELMSLVAFGFLILTFIIPYLVHGKGSIGLTRLYHILMMILSPHIYLGSRTITVFLKDIGLKSFEFRVKDNLRMIALLLSVLSLLNTGIVAEFITKDYRISLPISSQSIIEYGDLDEKNIFYGTYITGFDVLSSKWLSEYMNRTMVTYSDQRAIFTVLTGYSMLDSFLSFDKRFKIIMNDEFRFNKGYIYLRYFNTRYKVFSTGLTPNGWFFAPAMYYKLELGIVNKLYSNKGSNIYYVGS